MKEYDETNDQFSPDSQFLSEKDPSKLSGSKRNKPSLRERLQKHMAAIAYAEAGEYRSADEILNSGQKSRTVLLVVEGEAPDASAFSYALNLCTRMNAELDILQVIEISGKADDYELLSHKMAHGSRNLVDLVRQLEQTNIPFKVTMRLGEPGSKLFNYAKRHKDVAMVILDSPRARTASSRNDAWAKWVKDVSRQLSIPLIAVLDKQVARLSPEGLGA